jgi:hypothetical protein
MVRRFKDVLFAISYNNDQYATNQPSPIYHILPPWGLPHGFVCHYYIYSYLGGAVPLLIGYITGFFLREISQHRVYFNIVIIIQPQL